VFPTVCRLLTRVALKRFRAATVREWLANLRPDNTLPRDLFQRLRAADLLHDGPEFAVRFNSRRYIQQEREIARQLQAQTDLCISALSFEELL
jgi:hypothetical protein